MKVFDKILKFFGLCRYSVYTEVIAVLSMYALYVEKKMQEEAAEKKPNQEPATNADTPKKDLEPKKTNKAKSKAGK